MNPRKTLKRNWFTHLSSALVVVLGKVVFPAAATLGRKASGPRPVKLVIGAGEKGWELIEYQELLQSAREYCGEESVFPLLFPEDSPTLKVFCREISELRPTHYFFDPRSGSQKTFQAVWEALIIGLVLSRYAVTPVCSLTDFPVRAWRLQCAMVSARSGIVTTLMAPRLVSHLFPHERLIGPMPFPLSKATLDELSSLRPKAASRPHTALFIGSLYEPRKSVIIALQELLQARGIELKIVGRAPGAARISNEDYWRLIQGADLVVSTSSQISGAHTDIEGHNHFIYKFIEATAAGPALAIEPAPGTEEFFVPDVDYVSFTSAQEGAQKISSLWASPSRLREIASNGYEKTKGIIEEQYFWSSVDAQLAPFYLKKPTGDQEDRHP